MISLLGTGARSTLLIARNIVKRCSDVNDVALFDKHRILLAYAKSPGIEEVEKFRTVAKTRLVIALAMTAYIIVTQLNVPLVSYIFLVLIGMNTLYGWEKYSARCISTFGMNIIITALSYSAITLFIVNANEFEILILKSLAPGIVHFLPFILITLIVTLLLGYLISRFVIGDIKVLNRTECLELNIDAILRNKKIDKYIISKNGDYHKITNIHKKKKVDNKKHSFVTEDPSSIDRMR